jgi:cytidylate kinase
MQLNELVIAIDGPAGAGKSTVAKQLAQTLGIRYLDTGAMYRGLALAAQRAGLGPQDGERAAEILHNLELDFGPGTPPRLMLNGEDVSGLIRTLEIGDLASSLSTFPQVRQEMVRRQQAMVAKGGCILEGRDVTTVVAPNAHVKVYLTASLEERARRRAIELGQEMDYLEVRQQIEHRDHRDINRSESPLTVAPGAVVIDSANLPIDQVVERILDLCRKVTA